MGGDLFSAGFAWNDDPVASAATEDATAADRRVSRLSKQSPRRVAHHATPNATAGTYRSASEKVGDPNLFGAAVATVATVAETEGQRLERLLSQQINALPATPIATARTADFRGLDAAPGVSVAPVATVADWREGVERMRRVRPAPNPYHTPWRTLFQDAVSFLNLWAEDAVRLGWGTLDAFGGNVDPSHGRYDRLGLVILLAGGPIQCLDSDCAYIGKDGLPTVYRRALRAPGGIPVWQWIEGGSQ